MTELTKRSREGRELVNGNIIYAQLCQLQAVTHLTFSRPFLFLFLASTGSFGSCAIDEPWTWLWQQREQSDLGDNILSTITRYRQDPLDASSANVIYVCYIYICPYC